MPIHTETCAVATVIRRLALRIRIFKSEQQHRIITKKKCPGARDFFLSGLPRVFVWAPAIVFCLGARNFFRLGARDFFCLGANSIYNGTYGRRDTKKKSRAPRQLIQAPRHKKKNTSAETVGAETVSATPAGADTEGAHCCAAHSLGAPRLGAPCLGAPNPTVKTPNPTV
jgi:hypothetical protein